VICAENHLARCADPMNYGLFYKSHDFCHHAVDFSGPLTRWSIHRRQHVAADNSGSITIVGEY
jgi:hypothetical protein